MPDDGVMRLPNWRRPVFLSARRSAGLSDRFRVHDLRHTAASLLSAVPVHVVAARLGHADPAITLRVYAHVIRSAEAAAADIFADAVNAAC